MTKKDFIRSLTPEPHAIRHSEMLAIYGDRIRALYGNNPYSIFFILLIMSLHLVAAVMVKDQSWVVIFLTAYFFGAFLSHGLYVFLHEATHNLVFKTTLSNRIVGMMCDWFLIFPGSMAFRKYHLMHHAHQGSYDKDADIPSPYESRLFGRGLLSKLVWVTNLGIFQALRPVRFNERDVFDRWTFINLLSQILVISLFYRFLGLSGLGYLLLSTFFCLGLHPLGGRWIAEHYTNEEGQETFSYYGPVNLVMFNIGYHNEHHDFMGIAWNNLPKLKRLAPEYYDNLKAHRSYSKVLWNFLWDPKLNLYSRVTRENQGRSLE